MHVSAALTSSGKQRSPRHTGPGKGHSHPVAGPPSFRREAAGMSHETSQEVTSLTQRTSPLPSSYSGTLSPHHCHQRPVGALRVSFLLLRCRRYGQNQIRQHPHVNRGSTHVIARLGPHSCADLRLHCWWHTTVLVKAAKGGTTHVIGPSLRETHRERCVHRARPH